MANPALIGFSAIGDAAQPSPSVWGDCPNSSLNDLATGFFVARDFIGDDTTGASTVAPGLDNDSDTGSTFAYEATNGDHAIDVAVSNTDNNASAIFTRPLGKIVRGSGLKFWGESRFAPHTLGDEAIFFGASALAGLTRDVIQDNPSNTAVGTVVNNSAFGFMTRQTSSAIAAVDIVLRKSTGTVVTIATDVTNSSAITSAGGTVAPLVADAYHKFGFRFDGQHTLYFYVDGYKVATYTVDATVDQATTYGVILGLKTGAATAFSNTVDFFRAGAQVRT